MSEYITIDVEPTEAPDVVIIHTNQRLTTEGEENYESVDEGEVGSPLAQTLFSIEGIRALMLNDGDMTIKFDSDLELFILVDEVNAVLKDFFL